MKVLTGSSSQPNSGEEEEWRALPEIPSATLRGVTTFIRNDSLESGLGPEPISAEDVESLAGRRQEPNRALGP